LLENQLTARSKILQLTVKKPARFSNKSAKMATLVDCPVGSWMFCLTKFLKSC